MKIRIQPENPLEWMALKLNLVPLPLIDTQVSYSAARAIMAGAELGIYEAIGKDNKTSKEITALCNTNEHATLQLLNCLVGVGYLKYADGKYSIKPRNQKWLLKEFDTNYIAKLRFQILEWEWMAKLENYVRTGSTLQLHSIDDKKMWDLYQEGMRDLSVAVAKEVAGKIPISKNAISMLDIGGSHGLYSIELCKKYPSLNSTVFELPAAVEAASAIAKRYDTTGGRVSYRGGNALNDDLGTEKYDLVMINNVVHHFSEEQNFSLAKKIATALKPGGIYVIGEVIRLAKPGEGGVAAAVTSLYFSITSASGNWSEQEISSWQQAAGLKQEKTIAPMSLPGWKMVVARK